MTGFRLPLWRAIASLAIAATGVLGASSALAAEMGPGVADRIASASADERIALLVTMEQQVDIDSYAGDPEGLVAALRRTAATTQPAVADEISGETQSLWLVNAIAAEATAAEAAELAAEPRVASVSLDLPITAASTATNPLATQGDVTQGNWGLRTIGAPTVWSGYGLTGEGVVVGSIDTGVDANHPDLAGRIVAFRDFVNGRTTAYDDDGHGTHTIGTMIGRRASGYAIGVAPGARAVVAKAIAKGGPTSGSIVLRAAQWIADPDGNPATADQPDVVNNSWAAGGAATDPWFRPMIRAWIALGIVPVFAAGNTGAAVTSPASYPEAIAVGALDTDGTVAAFSARGPVSWIDHDATGPVTGTQVQKPDVVAPGVAISSSVDGAWAVESGTSMASPQVAGVIALLREADQTLTVDQIATILRTTARDAGPTGYDPAFGQGVVNAIAAVAAVKGPLAEAPAAPVAPAASGPTSTPVAAVPAAGRTARVSGLQVARRTSLRSRALVIRARLSGSAVLRIELRAVAAGARQASRTTGRVSVRHSPAGPVRVGLPLRGLRAGTYRLVVRAGDGPSITRRVVLGR